MKSKTQTRSGGKKEHYPRLMVHLGGIEGGDKNWKGIVVLFENVDDGTLVHHNDSPYVIYQIGARLEGVYADSKYWEEFDGEVVLSN